MRNLVMIVCMAALLTLAAGQAQAQSIRGKIGVTGLIGFIIPADSDYGPDKSKLETDAGLIGGGGLIYGIDNNFAAELLITHASYNGETPTGSVKGDFSVTSIALGGQYRFAIDQPNLTPYLGAGLDILFCDFDRAGNSVDNTIGVHLSGGIDYFINRQFALNVEAKALVAPETDINGGNGGNFDPSGFSTMFGIRYFFN